MTPVRYGSPVAHPRRLGVRLRLGLQLPGPRPGDAGPRGPGGSGGTGGTGPAWRAFAVHADEAGIAALWIPDDGAPHAGGSAVTTLAHVAAVTVDIALGLLVRPPFRSAPGSLLPDVCGVAALSSGRAWLGVDVDRLPTGGSVPGCPPPPPPRGEAAVGEDLLVAARASGETVARRPGVLVSGRPGRTTLRLAARHADACALPGERESELVAGLEGLLRACEREGRDPDAVQRVALLPFTTMSEASRPQARERLRRLAGLGVELVLLTAEGVPAPPLLDAVGALARDVRGLTVVSS